MPAETIRALNMPFAQAVDFFLGKINKPTKRWQDNYGKANVRGFSVAGAMTEALLDDFKGEMAKALQEGTTLAEFRAGFDDIVTRHGWEHVGKPGWRARVIYETNLSAAYSAGRYVQMTEPETMDAFPYWEYVHSGALHPRQEHKDWDGICLEADDPWWDTHYTPNGYGCGCWVRVVSRRGLKRRGKTGPDKAPPLKMKAYTDPKTGKVRQVPEGIDPGFEHNPGKVWLAQ